MLPLRRWPAACATTRTRIREKLSQGRLSHCLQDLHIVGYPLTSTSFRQTTWLPLQCKLSQAALDVPFASRIRHASTKAAKRKKQKHRYVRVPPRVCHVDGDFPVQLRPYSKPPQIRDLQDTAFDEEAALDIDRIKKVKPHHIREALLGRDSSNQSGSASVYGSSGMDIENVDIGRLKVQRLQAAEIPKFDVEKDLPEEDAADLAAIKARALAKRNYKWVPNPFGDKPGPLATSPEAEAKYYDRYFDGQRGHPPRSANDAENYKESRRPKPARNRISPSEFWYSDDHITPEIQDVATMKSQDLKYCMMNEAHLVRKWRGTQAEGRAAGMPPGSKELWQALGYRAAELATGIVVKDDDSQEGASNLAAIQGYRQQCSLSTALRFLQCLASVQAGPYTAVKSLVGRALEEKDKLRPLECFYLLQALSRLRYKHPKSLKLLENLSLSWRTLRDKNFVKAANAVAKLDISSGLWAKPLKAALTLSLRRLSGRHLSMLKGITVMELLDTPEAIKAYLEQCLEHRAQFWYSRHLRMVELHVHLIYPDVWQELDDSIKAFLQDVREVSENADPRIARPHAGESDDDSSDDEGDAYEKFDKKVFSSKLHADISRVLSDCLGVDHQNRLAAGPLTVDCCNVPNMVVVEAAEEWQFYLRSPQVTALARRRHELLRAMGFKFVYVPYHRWKTLRDDDDKAAYLRSLLPREVLSDAKLSPTSIGLLQSPEPDTSATSNCGSA